MVDENEKFTSKSKVDLARLPPCQSTLTPHAQHVNHRLCLYKRANVPIWERLKHYDQGQGWIRTEEGLLELLGSCGPVRMMMRRREKRTKLT
jgi:hypothetical protein